MSSLEKEKIEEVRKEWIKEAESYDMKEEAQINIRKYDIADWWLKKLDILLHQYDTLKREEVEGMQQRNVLGDLKDNEYNQAIVEIISKVFKGE